jgi:hypothetical protein
MEHTSLLAGSPILNAEKFTGGTTILEDIKELAMEKTGYEDFEALDPFFEVVTEGLPGLVDGTHYFDVFAEDAPLNPGVISPAGL